MKVDMQWLTGCLPAQSLNIDFAYGFSVKFYCVGRSGQTEGNLLPSAHASPKAGKDLQEPAQ